MKLLSPYWFLDQPIDAEHKYYILMDFFQSVEDDLSQRKYGEPLYKLDRIYNDLKNYQRSKKLTDKTLKTLKSNEISMLDDIVKQQAHNDEIEYIIEQSLENIDLFMEKLNPYILEIENSINFRIVNGEAIGKDKGYVVMRNNITQKIKIYSWQFSIIKVEEKDQVGLLLSELLDPVPEYSKSDDSVNEFFEREIKKYSKINDCLIIADLIENNSTDEISFDLIKQKSIDFIVNNYKRYLSKF